MYMLQKWNRLYKLFHPRLEIGNEEVGPRCLSNGPRLAYGWAFSRSDLRKYAEFHNVHMVLQEYLSGKLGKTLVKYGALSETAAQDKELLYYLDACLDQAVRVHLEYLAAVKLRRVLRNLRRVLRAVHEHRGERTNQGDRRYYWAG